MKKIKKEYIISLVLLVCFTILTIFVINNKIYNIDKAVYDFVISFKCAKLTNVLKAFTTLGNEYLTIVMLLILFGVFLYKKKLNLYKYIIANVALGSSIMWVLKHIIKRSRPYWKWIKQSGFSYPSGHTIAAFLLYGTLILIVNKKIKGKIKYVCYLMLSLVMLLIGISRIYFGAHYISDVIASILLALVILIISSVYIRNEENDKNKIGKKV